MSFRTRLQEATGGDVLAALQEGIGGTDNPPTPETLARDYPALPVDAKDEAVERALACADIVHSWTLRVSEGGEPDAMADALKASNEVSAVLRRLDNNPVTPSKHPPGEMVATVAAWDHTAHPRFHLDEVQRLWRRADCLAEGGDMVPHPLAPIVKAWMERPVEITPERRKDKRILPVVRVVETRPERQRGMLFGGLLEGRTDDALPQLPLFDAPVRKSVAILDMADTAGVPVMAQGKGAPLAARLFVRAGLAVSPRDRRQQSVRVAVTVRELRDGLFPNGAPQWGTRQWPALKAALIGASDFTIRLPDGCLWFMLALRRLPSEDVRGLPGLDNHVVLDVAFPPGANDGPVIDLAALDQLSVQSAPRWRAYIAAHALAWHPGKTQRPVPGAPGRYGWSRDLDDYPVLTARDRRRLAFGERDMKNRTRADINATWSDLPGLTTVERAVDPKTGEVGWRIVPADAARPDDEKG